MAPLSITPRPDQVIRVMMVYQSLPHPIEISPQILQPCERLESGFVAVEWGGSEHNGILKFYAGK